MSKINSGLKTTWQITWRILLFFLVWGVFLSFYFVPFGSVFNHLLNTAPLMARLLSDTISALTMLAATWAMTKYIDRRPFQSIGFDFNNILKDVLFGILIGIIWLGASLSVLSLFGWASFVTPVGFSWTILSIAALSMLFNVLTQELLLCGFIFQTIRNRSNLNVALLVSAALFAVYHIAAFKGEMLPAVNVFAAGLLFCLAYTVTNNLWYPIAIHFTWDLLLGPALGLTESGKSDLGGGWSVFKINGPNLFTGGSFGLEGGLIVTIITLLVIAFIYYSGNKNNQQPGQAGT